MDNIRIFNRTITLEQIRLAVLGASGVLCLWMVYSQTYPHVQDYLAKREENDQKRKEIEEMKQGTRNINQLRVDLQRMRLNLAKMRDRFPPQTQILSTLIVDLSDIFRQCDCELVNFTPGQPQALSAKMTGEFTKDLNILPIGISAKGSYSALITLFERLSRYERVLDMEGLSLSPLDASRPGEFSNKLGIQFTLTTYVLNR